MRFNQIITLKSLAYKKNTMGDVIKEPTEKKVLAMEKSIRQSEFYQAQATGLRPEITFIMWDHEYNNEDELEYNKKDYYIIRTYKRDDKTIELICQSDINAAEVTS